MNRMKVICLMFITSLLLNANEYSCKIDIVTDIDTKKFVSLPKNKWLNTDIKLIHEKVEIRIPQMSPTTFILPHIGSTIYMGNNVEIYEEGAVRLEIFDISSSWSAGARIFMHNRMMNVGFCNKLK